MISASRWGGKRLARLVVGLAFVVKLVVTVWNTFAYDNKPYDVKHHIQRATAAGLNLKQNSYDPPLYYLPSLAYLEDHKTGSIKEGYDKDALLQLLRETNLVYVTAFYLCWIYLIIPKLVPSWRSATVASLVLLALPGFQKLEVMTHPDNLLLALSSIALAFWAWLRARRPRPGLVDWLIWVAYGVVVGLVGWTRPFAAIPVVVLWLAGVTVLARKWGAFRWSFVSRFLVMSALASTISAAWYVYRWKETGVVGGTYNKKWVGPYAPFRAELDKRHFLTSFYLRQLLKTPNIALVGRGGKKYEPHSKSDVTNSFPTIAFSEFWGDHWLYFSSTRWRTDEKVTVKRVLFVVALPMLPLLALRWLRAGAGAVMGLVTRRRDDVCAILLLYTVLATAMYFYWLLGDALMPGIHSPIKFIYNAHIVPVAVTLAWLDAIRGWRFAAWLGYALLVFVVALPMAIFIPTGFW